MNIFKSIIEDYRYIKEAKKREAERSTRLAESERKIDERRRQWYIDNGMGHLV